MKKLLLLVMTLLFLPISSIQAQESKMNFLLLGTDTGYGRTEHGRSDAIMIATFDPDESLLTLSSIPRDSLVYIPGYYDDKVNHAYAFGGSELSKQTLEEWLGIEFDYFVTADMSGYIEIIDAIGGLTVTPHNSFTMSGFNFVGEQAQTINGEGALAYSRERKTSGGDYARMGRQREMVKLALEKVVEEDNIQKYKPFLESLSNHIETDITFDEVEALYNQHKDIPIEIEEFQLEGVGQMINGGWYDVPVEESVQELRSIVK